MKLQLVDPDPQLFAQRAVADNFADKLPATTRKFSIALAAPALAAPALAAPALAVSALAVPALAALALVITRSRRTSDAASVTSVRAGV